MATGNSSALYYLNPSTLGGSIQVSDEGFIWHLVGVFREPQTNRKSVISGIVAETLDGDSLVQVRDKLAAAVKAEGLARDFNVTVVVFQPLSVLAV